MCTEIQTVKNQMTLQNWAQEVAECQSSGMTVSAWCELHGINVKTYYYHLRRVREELLTESRVVPLSAKSILDNIEIFSGDVRIALYIFFKKLHTAFKLSTSAAGIEQLRRTIEH